MKTTNYDELMTKGKSVPEEFERLIKIVKVLRENCPWDKVQTHETLKTCMMEEAYEAIEAINIGDFDNLKEELGDVLLQVILHGTLAEEEKNFDIESIINNECEKMIYRHPYIFLEENVKTIDKALEKWENMKSKEQRTLSYTDRLKKVPLALPALMRSLKIQKRALKTGVDKDRVSGAFEDVHEELKKLIEAYNCGERALMEHELGDLLFSVVNVSRLLDINPEESLNRTSDKFIERFAHIEEMCIKNGFHFEGINLEEMNKFWDESKKFRF